MVSFSDWFCCCCCCCATWSVVTALPGVVGIMTLANGSGAESGIVRACVKGVVRITAASHDDEACILGIWQGQR